MGQVLLAYDSKLDRKVALKWGRAPRSSEAQTGLLRAAQLMARLSHPNVLTVHDAGELDGVRESELSALSGTPGYIASEALVGKRGPLSDQFSFFVSLYEALHGERPFNGPSIAEEIMAAERGEIPPPPPGREVPRWLQRAVRTGLAADPLQRYPSMAEALVALSDVSERYR